MSTNVRELFDRLSPERRARIEAGAAEMLAQEMSLQEVRKFRGLAQRQLAETLGIGQDSVSRIEKRSDMLLSTLRGYVEGLGGRLDLVVELPGIKPIRLTGFEDMGERPTDAEDTSAIRSAPAAQPTESGD